MKQPFYWYINNETEAHSTRELYNVPMSMKLGSFDNRLQCVNVYETIRWYIIKFANTTSVHASRSFSSNSSSVKHQIMLWHSRLGHSNFSYLKILFPNLFKGVDCSHLIVKIAFSQSCFSSFSPKPYSIFFLKQKQASLLMIINEINAQSRRIIYYAQWGEKWIKGKTK